MDEKYFSDNAIDDIFLINNTEYTNSSGKKRYGLYVNNTDNGTETTDDDHSDIGYNTCMCLYHGQANQTTETESGTSNIVYGIKIENIVDIETPGIITVHKFGGIENGTATYTSSTVDVTDESTALEVFTGSGGDENDFDHDRLKKETSGLAYLSYKSYESKEYRTSGNSRLEQAIDYSWKSSGSYSTRLYAYATGELNSVFNVMSADMSELDYSTNSIAPTEEVPEDYVKNDDENTNGVLWRNVAKHEVRNMLVEPAVNKISTSNIGVTYVGNYAYIGPFKATFSGGTPTIIVEGETANWARSINGTINTTNLVSSNTLPFYAVVNKELVLSAGESLDVKLKLDYTKYKTRLILAKNASSTGQQLMFHAGKHESDFKEIDWNVELTQPVTIQKQDENGNNLNEKDIKFEVYNSSDEKVGTLTTNATGSTSINLIPNETYKIKEIQNPAYGYKNATITGATMTVTPASGRETTETLTIANGEAQFKVTAGASHTINIRNTPQLGNLTIRKVDENGNPMAGVEFLVWQSNDLGYINIKGDAKHTTTSTGTDIKALYEQGKISGSQTYTSGTTTHYVTNENGEIVLNNLEIYRSKGEKYSYTIREVKNPNYGYKGMILESGTIEMSEDQTRIIKEGCVEIQNGSLVKFEGTESCIRQTNKSTKFTITQNTVLEINNEQKLGDLSIVKTGEDELPLINVKFVILQGAKYIRLVDEDTGFVAETPGDTEIDFMNYTIEYVTSLSSATKFVTGGTGNIDIKNLEVYSGADSSGNPVSYTYTIREVENENYGYKAKIIGEDTVTINESAVGEDNSSSAVDESKREVQFVIEGDTTINIGNTPKLGNLVIHKKRDDGSNLANVEFTIYQAINNEMGYMRLTKDLEFIEVIDKEIDITEYDVEFVRADDKDYMDKSTRFITNAEGKIIINNLEVYLGIDSNNNPVKYRYWICEEVNNVHGFKHMSMTEDDVTIDGGEIIDFKENEKEIGITLNEDATTITLEITNTIAVANLEIQKLEESENTNPLENVKFIIERRLSTYKEGETLKEYIVLKDVNGDSKEEIKEIVTINIDDTFEATEYSIDYTTDEDEATRFVTNTEGKIIINNLEVYASESDKEKSQYIVYEKYNDNYGYGSAENITASQTIKALTAGETATLTFTNKIELGNIEILKIDKDYSDIILPNVEFIIQARTDSSDTYSYLALQQHDGLVKEAPSVVIINENNDIPLDGSEYALEYVKTSEEYSEELRDMITVFKTGEDGKILIENLELNDRATGEQYTYRLIEISNPNYGYGVDIESGTFTDVTIVNNNSEDNTTKITINNEQEVTEISGYVWIENKNLQKDNTYDALYVDSTADIKLKDLYIIGDDGKLVPNDVAQIPVTIKLVDSDGTTIRTQPDEYIYQDENTEDTEKVADAGKYTFAGVKIYKEDENGEKILDENGNKILQDYKVIFEYDGFYYSTVVPNTEVDNGSKVRENENDRTELNNKFGTVESGDKIVSNDTEKIENEVIYDEVKNHYSALLGFVTPNLTKVKSETIVSISDILDNMKKVSTIPVAGVDNINMGLVLREQPVLWIDSSVDKIEVNVTANEEEHTYTYDYEDGDRVYLNEEYYYDKETGVHLAVKKETNGEDKLLTNRFIEADKNSTFYQTFVKSDIQAAEISDSDKIEMDASVIYKVSINNSSGKLTSVVHEIKNYFDSRYTIEEIGLSINANNEIGDIIYMSNPPEEIENQLVDIILEENVDLAYSEGIETIEDLQYNSVIIPIGTNGMTLESLKTGRIYIKYKISDSAISDLVSENAVYNNATEIIKYSTYYGSKIGTGLMKDENDEPVTKDIITENQKVLEDTRRTGEIYAGINLGSRPDNLKLKLVLDERTNVLKFDISEYENDSTAAQTLIVDSKGIRTISGNIFEDSATVVNNEKNGDGKYDENTEKLISNVKVELYKVTKDGAIMTKLDGTPIVATYADNTTPVVTEAVNGQYTLGGYTDEAGNTYGILPGRYIIQYTYGSYTDKDGNNKQTYINNEENKKIDVMDYKSTIIPEESSVYEEFKNKLEDKETNQSWFTIQERGTYSTAIDNLRLRAEYWRPISENSVKYGDLRGTGMTIKNAAGETERQQGEVITMTSQTLPMDVKIQFTAEDYIKVVKKDENGEIEYEDLHEELGNVNFGIVERPDIDIKINKKITEIEIIAQNGASIIPKGNPQTSTLEYITNVGDKVTAQIESKLLQGATLNLEYTVTVENDSNVDYICESYYYFGEADENYRNTPNAKLVVDYLDATMELDETKTENEVWKKETADNLKDNEYIDSDVHKALTLKGKDQTYYAYTTNAFEDVEIGGEAKSEKMYVTKNLSISDSIDEINRTEVIEVAGKRTIKASIPGNYVPTDSEPTEQIVNDDEANIEENLQVYKTKYYWQESDYGKAQLTIIPPTGATVDYTMYTIAAIAMLVILTVGIIIIKKKVIT